MRENVPSHKEYNKKHLLLALSFFKIFVSRNTHSLNLYILVLLHSLSLIILILIKEVVTQFFVHFIYLVADNLYMLEFLRLTLYSKQKVNSYRTHL